MYAVKYKGQFAYIKPWSAVRDSDTLSQQFLTPSIIEGMCRKLGVSSILRHKLQYKSSSFQQEVTRSKGFKISKRNKTANKVKSILNRGILLHPTLILAFPSMEDAQIANKQHLCLCRNEDLIYPTGEILQLSEEDFSNLAGFELLFTKNEQSIMVGYNRYEDNSKMYGILDYK